MPRRALLCVLVLSLTATACGDGEPSARPAATRTPTPTPTPASDGGVPGPPDAGTERGHGADARIRVPDADATPPFASLRLIDGGRVAVATGRDPESGIARTRVSIRGRVRCRDRRSGERFERPYVRYAPPPAIERTKVAPGAELPVTRDRRAQLWTTADCGRAGAAVETAVGRVWADVTNAFEREASSRAASFRLR